MSRMNLSQRSPAPQLTSPGKENILSVISDTVFEEGDSLGNSRSGAPQKNHGGSHALLSDKGL